MTALVLGPCVGRFAQSDSVSFLFNSDLVAKDEVSSGS